MQGVIALLVVCLAGVLAAGVGAWTSLRRIEDERAGYYGRGALQRRRRAEDDASTLSAIVALTHRSELAHLVAELDRLAWSGTPVDAVVAASPAGFGPTAWTLVFRDETQLVVQTDDRRAMHHAARLARGDALVVGGVQPDDDAVVVRLCTPRHEPLRVALLA